MKDGTENKLKFKQLQRRLKLKLWQMRGLLDTLWAFVRNNCPSGDIGRFSNEEIAIGIDWDGDGEDLIGALITTGWVDADDTYRLVVHDWWDHCEDAVHMKLARHTEVFCDGRLPKISRISIKERKPIEKRYKQKYGQECLDSGRAFLCVSKRTANALPSQSLALPSQAMPEPVPEAEGDSLSHSLEDVFEPNTETHREETPSVDLSRIDWDQVIFDTQQITKRLPPPNPQQLTTYLRLSVMCQLAFGDGFIPDALTALKVNRSREGPHQHFYGVIKSKALAEHQVDLWPALRRINPIPPEVRREFPVVAN